MKNQTSFKKGHKINVGRIFSKATRKRISEANKISHKGKRLSEEHKKNISKSLKGRKNLRIRDIGKGTRFKKGQNLGKKNPNWKGGITPLNKKIRSSVEYRLWRQAVFKRDNWTCIWCGQRGGSLVADHIKSFALFPELRFAIDNGRTLCRNCHLTTDTYAGRTKWQR